MEQATASTDGPCAELALFVWSIRLLDTLASSVIVCIMHQRFTTTHLVSGPPKSRLC